MLNIETRAEIEYGVTLKGMTKSVDEPKSFKQRKKESNSAFMRRVHRETEAEVNIAKFNEKFNVDLKKIKNLPENSIPRPVSEKRKK